MSDAVELNVDVPERINKETVELEANIPEKVKQKLEVSVEAPTLGKVAPSINGDISIPVIPKI